jgi:SPP1 gp7 family putative phage head morphogenesis protein
MVSLIDALTRHQAYLEGYKLGLEPNLDVILAQTYPDLVRLLNATRVDKLNALTKKKLTLLIRQVQAAQLKRFSLFRKNMLKELETFAAGEAQLNIDVFETITGQTVEEPKDNKEELAALLGLLALAKNATGRARLWALVSNTPDPATGLTPGNLLAQYVRYVSEGVRKIIVQGYANGWTINETLKAIFGTKANKFKDGFTAQAKRQGATVLHTVVQHVSSQVQAGVASVFYKFYEWVAVLDDATTDICRSRDGKIFVYGKGPLPPAHYRCRSRAVPVPKGQTYANMPGTFYGWLSLQPVAVQNDIVGLAVAGKLRNGRVDAATLGKFRSQKPLTLAQFLAKFGLIVKS